ncbi:uncharacterized protein LOC131937336 [Physella acuta]|uniref:uncharacterized protein LOC131937336 n=1 Tax=Physella acuta TaxID=109671 RepID=UPI0027DD2D17|nr:uncharacterized protein LOC131937336 [Physella acuta]XP_059150635.1 uncharacterized protein LOC131937336 [Physella acuta]XP_059150636.1 uncharacterized protein LOC131937336 [Physella acuta]
MVIRQLLDMMELKVWVDGLQKVVCGANSSTTCHDVVLALAHSMGRTGRFTLIEKWRESERPLTPTECPLQSLQKWGGYAAEVKFYLVHADRSYQGKETFRHTPPPGRHEPNTDSLKRSSTFSGVHYRSAGFVTSSLNKQSSRTGSRGIGEESNTNPATPDQLRTHSSSHTSVRSNNYFSVSGHISSPQSQLPNTSQHPHPTNTSQHPHPTNTSQLPYPTNTSQHPHLPNTSQHPHLPNTSQLPYPTNTSQHPHLPNTSQHPHLPNTSQHPHLPNTSQHPHLPNTSQHPHLPNTSQHPHLPNSSQYPHLNTSQHPHPTNTSQHPHLNASQHPHLNASQHPHPTNTLQHPHLPIPAPRRNVSSPLSLDGSSQSSQTTHLNTQTTHLNTQTTQLNSQTTHLNSQTTHEINLNAGTAPSPSEKTLHSPSDGSQYQWSPTDLQSDVHAAHHDLDKDTPGRALTSATIESSVRDNLSPSASTGPDGKKTLNENLPPSGHVSSSHMATHDSVNRENVLTKLETQKMSFVESAVKNSKTAGAARAPSSFASAVAHLRQHSNDGHLAADKTSAPHVRQSSNDGELSAFMQVPPRSSSSSTPVAFSLDTVHHKNIGPGWHHQGSHSRQASVEIEEYDLDEKFPDYSVGGLPLEYSLDSMLPVNTEYLQLIQFIQIQGERIDMQEVKLQETSMEISALESQHWPNEDNSGQLSLAQKQELAQLEQADWASVLASHQQQEENLKNQLARMGGQLEELERKLGQLQEQEERLSQDLLLAVEESINTEVSLLKEKLLKVDKQIGEDNKKLENMKSLISQMEELKQSKSREEAELEKLVSGKTVKQISSSEPINSPKSPTLTSAADSGETIIKILEGLSSPYPEGLATTFKSQNPNGVWV